MQKNRSLEDLSKSRVSSPDVHRTHWFWWTEMLPKGRSSLDSRRNRLGDTGLPTYQEGLWRLLSRSASFSKFTEDLFLPCSLDKGRGGKVWLTMHALPWPCGSVAGLIPDEDTCLGCGFNPRLGRIWEATNQCFSLSLPLSLKSNFKKYPWVRIKDKKEWVCCGLMTLVLQQIAPET